MDEANNEIHLPKDTMKLWKVLCRRKKRNKRGLNECGPNWA